jgi:hypothetical protein
MKNFQQLVIFDLKIVSTEMFNSIKNQSVVLDMTTGQPQPTRKYYLGNLNYKPLVVILTDLTTGDPCKDELVDIYNLYNVIVKHQTQMTSYDQMESLADQLTDNDRQIHWIWFRDADFYLPDKIMSRAKSWIALNPTFKFYLWTNLVDRAELGEFISLLSIDNQRYFTQGTINVKYYHETLQCVDQFCRQYLDGDVPTQTHGALLRQLYATRPPITTTEITSTTTSTHTITTTMIKTEMLNHYKINRIFKTDLLRIIVLNIHGGIYCDFNDTICFYPMKYLLTMYREQYFIGTDYDIEHPIFRNNYLIYNSLGNPNFLERSLQCINNAINEHQRITAPTYIDQYYQLCLDFISKINLHAVLPMTATTSTSSITTSSTEMVIGWLLDVVNLKKMMINDPHKDPVRVLTLTAEIFSYIGNHLQLVQFTQLHQRIIQELDMIDTTALRSYLVRPKRTNRHKRQSLPPLTLPIPCDRLKIDPIVTTHQFYDHFLIKYAIAATVGDLILSTNIAYTGEFDNLIPYLRSNRLSTISMLTHIYDGTSYGLLKKYDSVDPNQIDLRRDFL